MRRSPRGWARANGFAKQATGRLPSQFHAEESATAKEEQEKQEEQQREDEWVGMASCPLFMVGFRCARFGARLCGDVCDIGRLATMRAEGRRRRAEMLTADATVVHLVNLLATRQ